MRILSLGLIGLVSVAVACGGSADEASSINDSNSGQFDNSANNGTSGFGGDNGTTGTNNGSVFVPEIEVVEVRTVAATENYVFVPNSADDGSTVARIGGQDLSVTPIPVGLKPTDVVAFDTDGGSVAVVLVEGTSTAAIIRADAEGDSPTDLVHLLPIPGEVNALAPSPDGRHVLAYIDPTRAFPEDASVASLQAAALIRIGETRDADDVFELSVTRLIRDVEFADDGKDLFIVGREGINRLAPDQVAADAFVPPLDLRLSTDVFPPTDLEVEVAEDASFMVVRSSAYNGVSLHSLTPDGVGEPVTVKLPNIPTDIDLIAGDNPRVLATVRDANAFGVIDVNAALTSTDENPYTPEVTQVGEATAGLAQLLPDETAALLYSTLPILPTIAVYSLADATVRAYPLRNKIRSVAVAPNSTTAVIVHDPLDEAETDFQSTSGLTIFDIESGYRRPISLQAKPIETVMFTAETGESFVFVLLESNDDRQGVVRVDLQSFRNDFIPLSRAPRQIGVVADNIFVSQEATDGRITFLDPITLKQRTVSGYELNAGID